MSNRTSYCGVMIQEIGYNYRKNIYPNITAPICLVGMILNLLNVLVFTRKTMSAPPNLILAHLAFVDFLYLVSNIAHFWLPYIQFESALDLEQSYGWTILHKYIDIIIGTVQFISAFLTVQLAAWRYIAVVHPLKERHWCTKKITRNVMMTGYAICCVSYTIPYHLSFDVEEFQYGVDGKTYYKCKSDRHPIMNSIKGIVYGLVMKALSSLVLAGLTSRIVVALLARKSRHEQLSPTASTRKGMKNVETRRQTNRSTAILLAVAALFFIAEFPKGILRFLRTINKRDWGTCYDSLARIFMTITTHINTSITLMVYYTLSQQFRTTFKSLFNSNKRIMISPQPHTPLALSDNTEETESGWKISEV